MTQNSKDDVQSPSPVPLNENGEIDVDAMLAPIPADAFIAFIGAITPGETNLRFAGDGGFDAARTIWRYMSPRKFRSLVEERAIHFSRMSTYGDVFEGTAFPRVLEALYRKWASAGYNVNQVVAERSAVWQEARRHVLASCWHEKDYESVPMWERYCEDAGEERGQAIAVVSTQGSLQKVLPTEALVSRVRYVNFSAAIEHTDNPTLRAIVKSREYDDECEVRAIINDALARPLREIEPGRESGYLVDVDLKELVHRVVVSPFCDEIKNAITEVVASAGMPVAVESSSLIRNRYF